MNKEIHFAVTRARQKPRDAFLRTMDETHRRRGCVLRKYIACATPYARKNAGSNCVREKKEGQRERERERERERGREREREGTWTLFIGKYMLRG